jgi:alginate O-acetyltransferase complex protein AlgI
MLFNSATYGLFLPIVLALYFLLRKSLTLQNLLLLVASYIFYGWWDWRFLGLLAFSTTNDYVLGLALEASKQPRVRRALLVTSLVVNLGILGFFKYYNFFIGSLVDAFAEAGVTMHVSTLNIVLPVGISFYTFQSMTYAISIYRREFQPTRDPIAFFAYVAFFPQLVAGPIERASHFLPQFLRERTVTAGDFSIGIRRIVWGLFCKIVVADNCAVVANTLFNGDPSALSGTAVFVGAFFFAFQIYGDFSGYSNIAIGEPPISRAAFPSSGSVGTSRCRRGSATMSTSPLAAIARARAGRSSIRSLPSRSAVYGTEQTGPSWCGDS